LTDRAPLALALAGLLAGVFGRAAGFKFVRWDDPVNVTHNPMLTEPWSWDLVANLFNGHTALRFKPLAWLLHRATASVGGFDPTAWHVVSIVLHGLAAFLFWSVLEAVFARVRLEFSPSTRRSLAWFGAALWAVHPMHVEAACWITATPYPLLAVCLLGSFRCYVAATDPAASGGRRRLFAMAWILALLGYATYPVGVTYGLWLIAADVWILRLAPVRRSDWVPWLARHAAFLLPTLASVYVTWRSSHATPWLYPAPPTLAEVGLDVRLEVAVATLGAIGWHFLWPFGATPNNPILPAAMMQGPQIFATAAAALVVLSVAFYRRRRNPGTAGVIFGSALLSLPVLGFSQWPGWSVSDRYVYLPHLILTGGFALFVHDAGARWPAIRRSVAVALIVGLSLLGIRQVGIWRDTETLFRYLEVQPAFAWNPIQQAYIYQLWAAESAAAGDETAAACHFTQGRRVLQDAMALAAARKHWKEAVELSRHLEHDFGLAPATRRERVPWLVALGLRIDAASDLDRLRAETPADPALGELTRLVAPFPEPPPGNPL